MATSAADILSIQDARNQIQIDDDVPDARILPCIQGAVSYVQRNTGIPLIDKNETYYVCITKADRPISFPSQDIKELVSIKYWNTDQKMREEPAGMIADLSTLGRSRIGKSYRSARNYSDLGGSYYYDSSFVNFAYYDFLGSFPSNRRSQTPRVYLGFDTEIWPPEDGWPDALSGTEFVVEAKVGFDITAETEGLRQAIILLTRHFYEAPERLESDFAVMALIDPWKRFASAV